jgi:hypothetical protein
VNLGSVNNCLMTDGNRITDLDNRFLIQGVQDSTILDIDSVPDPDAIHISPENRIKPYTAVVAQNDISDNHRSFG